MGLSFPVSHSDEETILDHFIDLDVEIGQVGSEGIMPTRNYDDQVGMAVDEFNLSEDEGSIDYEKLNIGSRSVLDCIASGCYRPYVKIGWRRS